MDQGLGTESVPSGSIDKSKVLNVRPLRCLVPIFPTAPGSSGFSTPQAASFMCVPPTGPFPTGVAPFYPFFVPAESQRPEQNSQTPIGQTGNHSNPIPSPVPLNSFRTPSQATYHGAANGGGSSRRSSRSRSMGGQSQHEGIGVDEDGYSVSHNENDQFINSFGVHVTDVEDGSHAGRQKGKSLKRTRVSKKANSLTPDVDADAIVSSLLTSFNLTGLDTYKRADGDKELVESILLVFDLLRRKITQTEDSKEATPGLTRRPDLKAGTTLMTKGIRTNATKRIGAVPGVEVGDIFYFRMEMCVVGMHAPSMAGIDYMGVKTTIHEEPLAVSIVSSGGYDDDGEDGDVLIYSGQGGNANNKAKEIGDQKLERGNLALEKSLHRGNEVRVIRGLKDVVNPTGKVYVYDGLYKIQESWIEKAQSGCNVFKYKLVRLPGQPEAFTLWKTIQLWKDGVSSRSGVILPDLTSGAESLPVSLVNDIDDEKGPAYFTYFPSLKYSKPFDLPKPSLSCNCLGGCQPGVATCPCVQKNGGYLPYTALGVLLSYPNLVHECGPSCSCPPNCRNRVSQAGLKVRLEVFKTKDKGWGLRSWDAIRGGAFICEYAGEVLNKHKLEELTSENEDNYIFDATRTFRPLESVPIDSNESSKVPFPLVVSAKNVGNVARFMNHSCSPNVFWQPVLRESNSESYLHIAFFAIRHIPPMQELTYDYGIVQSNEAGQRRKRCLCGSLKCRGYF